MLIKFDANANGTKKDNKGNSRQFLRGTAVTGPISGNRVIVFEEGGNLLELVGEIVEAHADVLDWIEVTDKSNTKHQSWHISDVYVQKTLEGDEALAVREAITAAQVASLKNRGARPVGAPASVTTVVAEAGAETADSADDLASA